MIVIGLAMPMPGFAADGPAVIVIVNTEQPSDELSVEDVARIYQGLKTRWADGSQIISINRSPTSPIRAAFYRLVLNEGPMKEFYQLGSPVPFKTMAQQSPASAKRLVAHMPNAISYILLDELDDTVKALAINGVAPTPENVRTKRYPLCE